MGTFLNQENEGKVVGIFILSGIEKEKRYCNKKKFRIFFFEIFVVKCTKAKTEVCRKRANEVERENGRSRNTKRVY